MRQSSFLLSVTILGMVLTGCVKERRSLCPCLLHLDFSKLDTAIVSDARVNIIGPDGFVYDESLGSEYFDEEVVVRVPQGECMLCVYSGEQGLAVPDKGLYIPYGEDCPPVYMSASYLNTECEQCKNEVALWKNHCQLSICVEDAEHFPFHQMSVLPFRYPFHGISALNHTKPPHRRNARQEPRKARFFRTLSAPQYRLLFFCYLPYQITLFA